MRFSQPPYSGHGGGYGPFPSHTEDSEATTALSNAARGNTQDMEATSVNLFRKECQGCIEA